MIQASRASQYTKAILATAGAIATAAVQAFPLNAEVQRWGSIAITVVTAISVYWFANADAQPSGAHAAVGGE